jgi:hypothetical protein
MERSKLVSTIVIALSLGFVRCGSSPLLTVHADGAVDGDISSPVEQQSDVAPDSSNATAMSDTGMDVSSTDKTDTPVVLCPLPEGSRDGGMAGVDGGVPIAWINFQPSTNQCGSSTDLYCDGSAFYRSIPCNAPFLDGTCEGQSCPTTSYFPPGTPWVLQCLADLEAVGDLTTIEARKPYMCESVSNGTALYISFGGKSVGDLNCPLQPYTPAQAQMVSDCVSGPHN